MTRRRLVGIGALALGLVATSLAAYVLLSRDTPLPTDASGSLFFISDRAGQDALYVRHLPRSEPRRLVVTGEPVRDPASSPDGSRVAFVMGGRIGIVLLPRGEIRFVTLGVDHQDAEPSWRPDGRALVVSSRVRGRDAADLVLLDLDTPDGKPARTLLTDTRGLDETSPRFSPDGRYVVFVREDGVFRIALDDGRAHRLTSGFRKFRKPRFLPSGRLLVLWTEGKVYGFDTMDIDGKNRETLSQGTAFYRSITPSPDGRYLAATFTFDLAFSPRDAFRKLEEVHLLDARGQFVAVVERSSRYASHSPEWGR